MVIFSQYFLAVLVLVVRGTTTITKSPFANRRVRHRKLLDNNDLHKIEFYFCHRIQKELIQDVCIPQSKGSGFFFLDYLFTVQGFHSPGLLMIENSVRDLAILSISKPEERRKIDGPCPLKNFPEIVHHFHLYHTYKNLITPSCKGYLYFPGHWRRL